MTMPIGLQRPGNGHIQVLKTLGLTTNLKLCLDFGDKACYDGSSQTVNDLSGGSPAGFLRGLTSGSEASDPTFNGNAGFRSVNDYISFDGGDCLFYNAANAAWMETLHKDNALFSMLAWIYFPAGVTSVSGASQLSIVNTAAKGGLLAGFLIRLICTATGPPVENSLTVGAFNGAGGTVYNSFACVSAEGQTTYTTVNTPGWRLYSLLFDETDTTAGNVQGIDTTFTAGKTGAYASPDATNAEAKFAIGARVDAAGATLDRAFASGTRLGGISMWQGQRLTQTEVTKFFNGTRGRYGV